MNFKEIHIGELIRKIVKEDQLDPYKICSYLEMSETELTKMYHSKSLDSELLLKLSKVIKYDLFRVYSQHLLFYAPTNNNQQTSRKPDSEIPVFRKSIYTKEIIDFVAKNGYSIPPSADESEPLKIDSICTDFPIFFK